MKKSGLLLLLAVAFGCAESAAPPSAPEGSTAATEAPASTATQEVDGLALPPATATLVKFSCPGMT
ncbi:MAG: hypothetical protein ACYTGL_05890 [Planctomycetota bacterium]|jgi:hypothetical protein